MTELRYGEWPSPISAELVAAGGTGLSGVSARVTEEGGSELWWLELRPSEGGRAVLVCSTGHHGTEDATDVLPAPWSARTRVHEYGGGAWWLGQSQTYFTDWKDQRLYRFEGTVASGSAVEPIPLTPEPATPGALRYADGQEHPDGDWLVCVRETHSQPNPDHDDGSHQEPVNEIVAIVSEPVGKPLSETGRGAANQPAQAPDATVLASGTDFVSSPRFSPDGRWLSWVRWNHPNMPWGATELCAAPVFDGQRIGNVQVVAGSLSSSTQSTESLHGADWLSDGTLVFSSDRNGYWNLYSWSPEAREVEALTTLQGVEIGSPPWVFGTQRWVELDDRHIVVVMTTDAVDSLGILNRVDPASGIRGIQTVSEEYTSISSLTRISEERVALVAAGPRLLPSIIEVDVSVVGMDAITVRRSPADPGIDSGWFSEADAISFDSPMSPGGPAGARTAHAFYYPPTAPGFSGPADTLPPLLVMGHGGPTSHSGSHLSLKIQYWTSRGIGVVDVNYGGSSGFGRAYRDLLNDAWGIVDVEDCIAAAASLAEQGQANPDQLAIRGGSAGGLTVLLALINSEQFAAGTSLYGVADLTALAADTHKFESRYLDGLIGPYPEREDIYVERSPITNADRLSSPLLVLQGLEDEVVPPSQSEAIVAAVAAKNLPHAYVTFEGEQHGFRQAETIVRSLEVELWFYGKVLGFVPADQIEAPEGAVGLS